MAQNPKHKWTEKQIKDFVKGLREDIGDGWAWMVPAVRDAMVAEMVLNIIMGNHQNVMREETIWLLRDCRREAGLKDEEN